MGAWGYGLLECDDAYDVMSEIEGQCGIEDGTIFDVMGDLYCTGREDVIKTLDNKDLFSSSLSSCYSEGEELIHHSIFASFGLYHLINDDKFQELIELAEIDADDYDNVDARMVVLSDIKDRYNTKQQFIHSHRGLFETILEEGK